jgi:RNA recognition motif-containing protein
VKRIYIGNLPFDATETDIRALFEAHGTPESVSVITDPGSGRSRGFAFVEMNDSEAEKAVAALNGTDLRGRNLNVNEARPKREAGGRDRQRGGRERNW